MSARDMFYTGIAEDCYSHCGQFMHVIVPAYTNTVPVLCIHGKLIDGTHIQLTLPACRYIPTNEDGIQKMHRFISSRDVEEYSTDVQPRDIKLTKDEDIEYRSGTLYSSSGTTFVEILTFSRGTQQQLADEEEPSNLTDSNTFTVNGSYTLDRMQCYTLSKSAAAQRNRRSVDNMVVTSLRATINKREYLRTKSIIRF